LYTSIRTLLHGIGDSIVGTGSARITSVAGAASKLIVGTDLEDNLERPTNIQRALVAQREHSAAVKRLRKGLLVGLAAWQLFLLIDWLVATFVVPAALLPYVGLRLTETLVVVVALIVLRRTPAPSPRATQVLCALVFGLATASISLMCLMSGGLQSHYAAGIPVVVCAWGIFAAGRWRDSFPTALLMAASYPVVMLISALFIDEIAVQMQDAASLTVFLIYGALIVTTTSFSVVGGHTYWKLRRQVFESRNIGKYRLLRRIGVGGSSEVWEASHQGLKRKVAMKILRADDTGVEADRFQREIEATIALTHPNTIRIFDYGSTEDGLYYYTMELLDGQTVRELAKDNAQSPVRSVKIISQACRALAEAHELGVIHRDIKPANIFVTQVGSEADVVKLLDFGIAKQIDTDLTLTEHGWVVGSPHYISPEVACGSEADARSDVYSAGATLYFALTGRPPFTGKSVGQLLQSHVNEVARSPSDWRADVLPSDLEAIVMRCLAKEPAHRFKDARELLEALQSVDYTKLRDRSSHSSKKTLSVMKSIDPLSETLEARPVS